MHKFILALIILALAGLACGGTTSQPQVPPTPQHSVFDSGRTVYGFFPSPIRVELQSVFDTYKRIGEHADVVLLQQSIPWQDFVDSTDGESQTITDLTNQMILCDQNGLEAIFVVDPLNGLNRREFADLPWGWEASFANPDIRSAFRNFTLRILREYHPRYLGLASEINTYADAFPEDFPNYVSLYNEVYAAVKTESPETQVFVTFQWEDLNNLYETANEGRTPYHTNWELVDVFEPNLDLWVISTYPFGAFRSATEIPDNYYTPLLTRTSKILAVAEGGFSSEAMEPFGGSDEDQIAYLTKIHNQLGPRLAYWIYIIINDLDMNSYAPNMKKDQDTLAWFTRMGFFDIAGNPKPALEVWDGFEP
jgi:hypothetical protein